MQHVTRLGGSLLHARLLLLHTSHGRLYTSFVPLGKEQTSTPVDSTPKPETPPRTLRPRSHGNPSLPISALFDPVTVAAREKHKAPKEPAPEDSSDLTPFQRELAQNAYAHILATPVRTCVLTKARLPSHFLIPFVTNMPPGKSQQQKHSEPSLTSGSPSPQQQPPRLKPSLTPRQSPSSSRPSSYILASHSAISHLNSFKRNKWTILINERMKKPWAKRSGKNLDMGKSVAREWEWDAGMVNVVKARLERDVVGRLKWLFEQGMAGKDGEGDIRVRVGGEREGGRGQVYDLRGMVGKDALSELRQPIGGAEEIVLRKHVKTWSTHAALEKLRSYVRGNGNGM